MNFKGDFTHHNLEYSEQAFLKNEILILYYRGYVTENEAFNEI